MRMDDTICALSTAQGMGAIAMIRISGQEAFPVMEKLFKPFSAKHKLSSAQGYRNVFGKIVQQGQVLDEVMLSVYRSPASYTGEDVIEIACHGSVYIQEQIIRALLKEGIRLADPGEYTLRAYLNGKMDLSQAEAVADLIASESAASHQVALQQMRGGFSAEIRQLREELINFVALIELELDFSEEDVEFANRAELEALLDRIQSLLERLIESYDTGNVIKNGVPVAIVGAPNAGKSTLLNALLNEEKAIVTEVAGTTRDAIEDELHLGGITYRFIDTAGIRHTEDIVEKIGIERTFEKIEQSALVLHLIDARSANLKEHAASIREEITLIEEKARDKQLLILANKSDQCDEGELKAFFGAHEYLAISAKEKHGLEELLEKLKAMYDWKQLAASQSIVTNARHLSALQNSLADILKVKEGLAMEITGDLLSLDIRAALAQLGSIIGEVDVDKDILGAIFGKFCIGK